jgi:hypothetical protein
MVKDQTGNQEFIRTFSVVVIETLTPATTMRQTPPTVSH